MLDWFRELSRAERKGFTERSSAMRSMCSTS